jgi:hypothetical protein
MPLATGLQNGKSVPNNSANFQKQSVQWVGRRCRTAWPRRSAALPSGMGADYY